MGILSGVTRSAQQKPPRIVLYAAEKFGKTSFGCHSWKPIFLMTQGETGLQSLLEAGRVPPTDHFPQDFQTWGDLIRAVRGLLNEDHDYKTLVIDTGNGAELLCAADVCNDKFGGNWADYYSYGRGNEQATKSWAAFLALLDEVRLARRMAILILQHAKVKTFQDPAGKDWDQWRPEAIDKLWSLTHKWADAILFGGFKVQVSRDGKATGEQRYLKADASGSIVAGNRYGLPAEITASAGPDRLWAAFADAMKQSRERGKKQAEHDQTAPAAPPPPTSPPPVNPPVTPAATGNGSAKPRRTFSDFAAELGKRFPPPDGLELEKRVQFITGEMVRLSPDFVPLDLDAAIADAAKVGEMWGYDEFTPEQAEAAWLRVVEYVKQAAKGPQPVTA